MMLTEDFRVLATDYYHYAVVYSCTSWFADAVIQENLRILSRHAIEHDTVEYYNLRTHAHNVVQSAMPWFDPSSLRDSFQGRGCIYDLL